MKIGRFFFITLYGVTILLFILYIAFFSDNNFAKHRNLNKQIADYETKIAKTRNQIKNTRSFEELKKDPELLEQYAREQMDMHKSNEDVFVIVYE